MMALAGLFSAGVGAQTIYDAANLTELDLNGSARFVGMGGAMSALGGDLSTMGTNPAGIGIYRSNDASVSFGFSSYGTESSYMGGNPISADKTRGSFDHAGFVFSTKIGNRTALRYVNFGFSYKRAKSFCRDMQMAGNLGSFSQTFQMANQAQGITGWGNYPYEDSEIGWLSIMGYDGYLITDLASASEVAELGVAYEAYTQNGTQVSNTSGELMYRTPGYYRGMYEGGDANFLSRERGGIDQYDFNVSFNVNDRVYLGVTIGAYAVDYSKYSFYDEDYGNGEGYNLQTWSKIKGSGFDVKLGAIFRPFENSPLRVGLAIHTPTFYDLDYKTNARLESDVHNYLSVANESGVESDAVGQYDIDTYDILGGDMVRQFQLRTPWKYNVSLGYTIGTRWALGAEYEYQDYSTAEFRDAEGYSETFAYENSTTGMLKGVSTVRLGLEYKIAPQFAFRLGYNYRSSIFKDDAYKDLPYNSIQTDTDFANSKSLSNYTVGLGYRGSVFYADVAYKYTTYKADFYPIDMFDGESLVQATKLDNTRSQVLLTLGVRF